MRKHNREQGDKTMKFNEFGYKNETVEVREMTMADIALTIAQALIRKDRREIEIRIVETYCGEVETYKGMDEMLSVNWQGDHKVRVYGWAVMHNNVTDTDYVKIVISDDYYNEEDDRAMKQSKFII